MRRYGRLAELDALSCGSSERRAELQRIAAHCMWLSEHPAQDFWQALQSVWFLFVLLQIESKCQQLLPGRFGPVHAALPGSRSGGRHPDHDRGAGAAREFVDKVQRDRPAAQQRERALFAGFPIGFNVILGGQLHGERDATNFLSYMCLRAQADLGLTQPNLSIRVHESSPREFLLAAAGVIAKGSGMPQVFNDAVIVPGQIDRGVDPEDGLELRGGRLRGALDAGQSVGLERCLHVQPDARAGIDAILAARIPRLAARSVWLRHRSTRWTRWKSWRPPMTGS